MLPDLINGRDEQRHALLLSIKKFLSSIEEAMVMERVTQCHQHQLPQLDAMLRLCSTCDFKSAAQDEAAVGVALERIPEFQNDSITQLEALSQETEAVTERLQSTLVEAAKSLSITPGPNDVTERDSTLNKLFQEVEAAAHKEVCWVKRHNERCWDLQDLLSRAGCRLRQEMLSAIAKGRRLLALAKYYEHLSTELGSLEKPDAKAVREAMALLKDAKRSLIQKKAEFELSELSGGGPGVRSNELTWLLGVVQEQQIAVENETAALALSTVTYFPELPLLHPDLDFYDTVGRANIDGLWMKGRRIEDYTEEERLTGGRHVVIVATFGGHRCALKEYNVGANALEALRNELLVLSRLQHPNIISVDAVIVDLKQFRAYVQMPYFPGGTMTSMLPPWSRLACANPHLESNCYWPPILNRSPRPI